MGGSQPWPQVPVGNKDHTDAAVVIIGAGISGMCMAIDLIKRNQCHNFIIVEKSSSVGGTWHDNKYPGCCCDIWSMLYSYSFEQNPDWTREYPGQEEILDYLRNVARKYNLYKYIRFNTSVESATWDDSKNRWKVDVTITGGKDAEFNPAYSIECDFLVSAVGQLNQPRYPDIDGLKDFKGKIMHSARWDWSYKLDGKRVGIIGNGATAAQIIPEILPSTSSLTVYQRSPNWVIPRDDGPVGPLRRAIYRYLPPVRWRMRSTKMDIRESFYDAVTNDKSDSADVIRSSCFDMMKKHIPGKPDLWEKLTPDYSPGCKRVIISDDYYPALANPKTNLETTKIKRITEFGIELQDGTHHDHDIIVLATGFRTVEFLYPIKVTGTQGRSLGAIWEGGATALYGTTVPSLPNFGMFYGPNTNLGHNSIILMIEAQSRYLNTLVSAVLDGRNRGNRVGLMPKQRRTDEFNDQIQEILKKSSFADPACQSWYKNKEGRITNNWSGTVVEYQEMLSKVDWEDFETTGLRNENGVTGAGTNVSASRVVFGSGKQETKIGRVHEETSVSNTVLALGTLSAVAAGAAWVYRGRFPKRLGLGS
ncbi:flavin-binding monooxygenase-like protein [Cucurbitaria berberidis CBS 394.84]|uniref:Flavin-binding monooxygenase-like protein n=1 Tax=Cucurbitaria berberidis CBS 394.84 TaxID=1168544 RepID=A0A9P4LAH2_9PLEO|nr:flavin-binding monooxygenase-like protein [Cucurbitaria berberidis CBS 394.84]KAF1847357.1 flavin-binding monooxygenase-like protein [Cucurbitaria berberidis CBS 394.84]